MAWATSLVIDNGSGEQIVRGPRSTDAIGGSLRDAYSVNTALPQDMVALLRRLDEPRQRLQ